MKAQQETSEASWSKSMINRRRFLQGIAGGLVLSPLLSYGLPKALSGCDKYIPGWAPNYQHTYGHGRVVFEDFFAKDYFWGKAVSREDTIVEYSHNLFHQNLYDPPMATLEDDEDIDLCIISASLKDIYDLERLHLFEELFHKAYCSFGCLTLPPNADTIVTIRDNKDFNQLLERLPCPVVLIDAHAIERTVPKLPTIKPHSNNTDRILQSTIIGILAPLVVHSYIGIDSADFLRFMEASKLVGMGIGFMNHSAIDLNLAAEEAVNTIYDQIAPGMDIAQKFDSCWVNVCGNDKLLTMDMYQVVANKIHSDIPEHSNVFIGLTIDNGLEDDIMITCFGGLALESCGESQEVPFIKESHHQYSIPFTVRS